MQPAKLAKHVLGLQQNLYNLDVLPPCVVLNANAWQEVITEDPQSIFLVDPSFWGTEERPSSQGIAVGLALNAQNSVFRNCLPYHVKQALAARYGLDHPSEGMFRSAEPDCPPAPTKRARY